MISLITFLYNNVELATTLINLTCCIEPQIYSVVIILPLFYGIRVIIFLVDQPEGFSVSGTIMCQ